MQEISERKRFRRRLIIILIFLVIGIAGYIGAKEYMTPKYEKILETLEETSTLTKKVNSVESERNNYTSLLAESGKVYEDIVSKKEEYITYIGEVAMANQLDIEKMTVGNLGQLSDQLYSIVVEIEVEGDLYHIRNMVQELYDSETVNRINTFSYRLEQKDSSGNLLNWLSRERDSDTLIPWWDMQSTATSSGQKIEICADDLMAQGDALCYLEVEFIGTEGRTSYSGQGG